MKKRIAAAASAITESLKAMVVLAAIFGFAHALMLIATRAGTVWHWAARF